MANDFVIEYGYHKRNTDPEDFPGIPYGILKEYHGPGGDVVVPDKKLRKHVVMTEAKVSH